MAESHVAFITKYVLINKVVTVVLRRRTYKCKSKTSVLKMSISVSNLSRDDGVYIFRGQLFEQSGFSSIIQTEQDYAKFLLCSAL